MTKYVARKYTELNDYMALYDNEWVNRIEELEAENKRMRERVQSVMDEHFDETSGIYEDFKQALKEASYESK